MTARTSTPLRKIAVHVAEAKPGRFTWVLNEAGQDEDGRWAVIQRASKALPRYHEAMAAGLVALEALVGDLDIGPREEEAPDSDAGRDPSVPRKSAKADRSDTPAPTGGKGTAFGFGRL